MEAKSKTKEATDSLEVYLDIESGSSPVLVGMLSHERGAVRFQYDDNWLNNPSKFSIDPTLSLDKGVFYPDATQSNFGVFLDSSPDRWGQKLMERRERFQALDEKRSPRKLHAWDFLIGVQDHTRMGALRFKKPGADHYLDNHPLPCPPVTSLGELASIAAEISSARVEPDPNKLRKWLSVLVAPGASLGGAHPKANYREKDGSLWIAKFPSRDDTRDNALWEIVTHELAREAGIACPPAVVRKFNNAFHTFCVKRFDRVGAKRRFFVSAMTVLKKSDGTEGSYLDLVDFITANGQNPAAINRDLKQLYRRVVFNAMVGNCDDHFRNHGFMFEKNEWTLSDAYDMNPSTVGEHVLSFDGVTKTPSADILLETAQFYNLSLSEAELIYEEIRLVVSRWKEKARGYNISADDIKLNENAFALTLEPSAPSENEEEGGEKPR